jgi:hypothetical protein
MHGKSLTEDSQFLYMLGGCRADLAGAILSYIAVLLNCASAGILFVRHYCFVTIEAGMEVVSFLGIAGLTGLIFTTLGLAEQTVGPITICIFAALWLILALAPSFLTSSRTERIVRLI